MKKTLAILALVAFLGGIGAPAFANTNSSLLRIELADKEPNKKETKRMHPFSGTIKKASKQPQVHVM